MFAAMQHKLTEHMQGRFRNGPNYVLDKDITRVKTANDNVLLSLVNEDRWKQFYASQTDEYIAREKKQLEDTIRNSGGDDRKVGVLTMQLKAIRKMQEDRLQPQEQRVCNAHTP